MKKKLLPLIIILLILPSILAINLEVEKISKDEVIIHELYKPATFELKIKNLDIGGDFEFSQLPGFFTMDPQTVKIQGDNTKTVRLNVSSLKDYEYNRFFYVFQYQIKDSKNNTQSEDLTIKIVSLKDAFKIGTSEIDPESNSIEVYIENKENFEFESLKVKFSSPFFELDKEIDLKPKEKEYFNIKLEKENFNKLNAGFYTLKADIEIEGNKESLEGTIKFSEKELVTSEKKDYGFLIVTKVISKINQGNTEVPSDTSIEKNIISRLFTTFSPEPDIATREGMKVTYTWNQLIQPGETLNIVVKTNWLFPFAIIILVVAIVVFAKQSSGQDLVVRKKVSFVKTKGGEFALKVTLIANAKKYVERINIVDKLPPLVKVHERFGPETPSRIDEKNRRVEWDIEKLEAGEIRLFNYIIYSKVGVVGKFALPAARVFYEVNGKIKEIVSNMAFFIAEQTRDLVRDEDY
jgi:hypothetical protein